MATASAAAGSQQRRDPTLAVAAACVALLAALTALRLVLRFGHPDDRRSAWIPRGVATVSLALAACTLLLFPLDVANTRACEAQQSKKNSPSSLLSSSAVNTASSSSSSCVEGVPAAALWRATYITNGVMTFFIIPLAYFYYLGDSELAVGARMTSAALWAAATAAVAGGLAGLCYALWGFADVPVTVLASGAYKLSEALAPSGEIFVTGKVSAGTAGKMPLDSCVHPSSSLSSSPSSSSSGLELKGRLCDAVGGRLPSSTWSSRVTFPTYAMALLSTAGWALFLAFAGAGFVSLPADALRRFAGRPRATIPRSEYAKRAAVLGSRASALRETAQALRAARRGGGGAGDAPGGRRKKSPPPPPPPSKGAASAVRRIERELLLLEEDCDALESVHPRGEDAPLAWAATVAGHWLLLFQGVAAALASAAWVAHLAVAVFPQPPASPALNVVLEKLDGVTPLLGSLAFAGLAFHLVAATVSGAAAVSLVLPLARPHALRVGATHASALLFNAGLVLLASCAAVQLCAQAFAVYSGPGAAVAGVFGAGLRELRGLRIVYQRDVFTYALVAFCGLSVVAHVALGAKTWRRDTAPSERGGGE